MVLFTYSNPLLSRGLERFCEEAAAAGAEPEVIGRKAAEEGESEAEKS